jgi:hypothetical protein
VSTSVRRHRGSLSELQTEHHFVVGLVGSIVGFLVVVGAMVRTADGFLVGHAHLLPWRWELTLAAPAVLVLAGLWSFLGLIAGVTRAQEQRRRAPV